jgi:hypothetical protein
MGRIAASLRFDRIARGEVPKTGNRIVFPVEIVLRRSCGCKHRGSVVIHQRAPLVLAGVVLTMLGLLAAWIPAQRALEADALTLPREE